MQRRNQRLLLEEKFGMLPMWATRLDSNPESSIPDGTGIGTIIDNSRTLHDCPGELLSLTIRTRVLGGGRKLPPSFRVCS